MKILKRLTTLPTKTSKPKKKAANIKSIGVKTQKPIELDIDLQPYLLERFPELKANKDVMLLLDKNVIISLAIGNIVMIVFKEITIKYNPTKNEFILIKNETN